MPGKKWKFWKVRVLEMLKGYHRKMPYWEMVHMIFTDLTVKLNSWQGQDGEWRYPSAQGPSDVIKRCQKTHKKNSRSFDISKGYHLLQSHVSTEPRTQQGPPHRKHACLNFRLPPKWPATKIQSNHMYTQILHKSPYRQSHVF